jgi:hypothetical protein
MLILRLHAGLPTIYQSTVDRAYLFINEGVFECDCGYRGDPNFDELERCTALPASTWALIDSNQNLIKVPLGYQNRYFVVQASLPSSVHFAWRDKVNFPVDTYIMQPWTITELLQGYV